MASHTPATRGWHRTVKGTWVHAVTGARVSFDKAQPRTKRWQCELHEPGVDLVIVCGFARMADAMAWGEKPRVVWQDEGRRFFKVELPTWGAAA